MLRGSEASSNRRRRLAPDMSCSPLNPCSAENQWDRSNGGSVTRDRMRTRSTVRLNALFHNWWSV